MRPLFLAKYPDATTLVNGVSVALCGNKVTSKIPGNQAGPPTERTVRGATQSELKYLFEVERHPFIEEIEETK